jgi:hypothetical protein
MQMTAGGPPGGAYPRDDLAYFHTVARVDANGLEMVVGGDEAVPVVNLYAVAAAPRMPACRTHHPGIGCIDGRATGGCVILAQVEVPRRPAERTDPEAER